MNSLGFQAAFFAHKDSEVSVRKHIANLECELKLHQSELEHAQELIVAVVQAVKSGQAVKIQDRYGDSVVVAAALISENGDKELRDTFSKLAENQEPLGSDLERVWSENLDQLYQE